MGKTARMDHNYSSGKVRRMNDSSHRSEKEYHATKKLLSIYRNVEWQVESSVDNIRETAQTYGNQQMYDLIVFLSHELEPYDSAKDKKAIEDRIRSLDETQEILVCVKKALEHLKAHPDGGEIYYDIIYYSYINKDKMTDQQIREMLHLSQPTFYRYKRKAIEMMGIALWGFFIPDLLPYWKSLETSTGV